MSHLDQELERIVNQFGADSGTIHLLEEDGVLHLKAATANIPPFVLDKVKLVPVGKGMAGLAVERNAPVNTCNIQTDTTGDVRAGARATGLEGAIVVPITRDGAPVGALGIANRSERTFTEQEINDLMKEGRGIAEGL